MDAGIIPPPQPITIPRPPQSQNVGQIGCLACPNNRLYGKSQFFNYPRLIRVARDLLKLWWRLMIRREHMRVQTH
jgi:hypothetical protein